MPNLELKAEVQGAYDLQKVRIAFGNRIVQAWMQGKGVKPGLSPETELAEEDLNVLTALRKDFTRLTDGLLTLPRRKAFKPTEFISSYALLEMLAAYEEILTAEGTAMRAIAGHVKELPIWDAFFAEVRGCGPTMAAVVLAMMDINKADTPSKFWAFAGYDVAPDGRGRSRRKEHLIMRDYLDKEGNPATRLSITFNPWVKTKLHVLATCLVKAGGAYKVVYDNYKHRIENHPNWKEKTPGHRHAAAMRYMIKQFLLDLWLVWRQLEGLPIVESYAVAKLGAVPHHINSIAERELAVAKRKKAERAAAALVAVNGGDKFSEVEALEQAAELGIGVPLVPRRGTKRSVAVS